MSEPAEPNPYRSSQVAAGDESFQWRHSNQPLSKPIRRAMHLANLNAGLWAVGNGLVSTLLVVYLAQELGAAGLAVSLILAAPRLVGVLRVATPELIARMGNRKNVCVAGYAVSGIVLWMLPALAAPGGATPAGSIALLVGCWCVYHLLEYMATVALWSWLGDWMPPRVRGRLIGRREQWLTMGRIAGIGASVLLATQWERFAPGAPRWQPLAWSAAIGAPVMLLAIVPLLLLPSVPGRSKVPPQSSWRAVWVAVCDPKLRPLLIYSCWFAFANGITGAAQSLYPYRVLGLRYEHMIGLRSGMYAGQTALAPQAGTIIDRFGARSIMVVAQVIVATGPLFFWFASPQQPWWIAGAYVAWMAYAALNVGLDTLKLKLSPEGNSAPHLAVYHALGDLVSGVTLVVAGAWYDLLSSGGTGVMHIYMELFLAGFVARLIAAGLAWRIRE